MKSIEQLQEPAGPLLVVAPHMDDETLGCGLLLAAHPRKEHLHLLFVTDGSHSPEPSSGADDAARRELARTREQEARGAMAVLGIPADNASFLGFEDGTLASRKPALRAALVEQIRRVDAGTVLVPFRYDRHPDHLAISHAVADSHRDGAISASMIEYFVYSQWRLLRGGDVRDYLPAADLRLRQPTNETASLKRRALECHRSQVSCYFDWQTRPILTRELVERVCAEPEVYLLHDARRPGRKALARSRTWVPVAHRLEPWLKRCKDRLAGWPGR
ncbi:MAG: PIG-L family deacetylase [Pseudomonadota bacterium]|nr:PIG-L family deacetylase [Pseudomonadota bacterium]